MLTQLKDGWIRWIDRGMGGFGWRDGIVLHEWMVGWINGWMEEGIDGWVGECVNE